MKEKAEKIRKVSISKVKSNDEVKWGQKINKDSKLTILPKRKKQKLATKSWTEIFKVYKKLNNQL